MKKIISILIMLSVLFSTVPVFNITASAASTEYLQTAKDNVPLRNNYGEDNTIVARILKKGSAVSVLESKKKLVGFFKWNTWHKVQIMDSSITSNNTIKSYWIYDGNLTKHKHNMNEGVCVSLGCGHIDEYSLIDTKRVDLEVTQNNSPTKHFPFNGADTSLIYSKGKLVTATAKYKNAKNAHWYKLEDSTFIYSGNVKIASEKKVQNASNTISNGGTGNTGGTSSGSSLGSTGNAGGSSGGSSSGSTGNSGGSSSGSGSNSSFNPLPPKPCYHTSWSVGKCVNCGKAWELREVPVSGTYAANKDGVVVRDIPYKQGKQIRKLNKGDTVKVVAKATNSANHVWYKTNEGYWVYEVGQVKLKRAYFSKSGHTFYNLTETVTPKVIYEPSNAAVTKTWKISSGKDFVSLDTSSGKITPKKAGKATIVCMVKGDDGTTFNLEFNVVIDEIVNLETWSYDNQKYNQDLALECVEYSALAYPDKGYYLHNDGKITLKTAKKTTEPMGLTSLLKHRGFNYQVSNNYYNMTEENSPFTLASKKVNYNGNAKDVIYVIIEGSAGKKGWQGNMKMASSGNYYNELDYHYTFNASAKDIKKQLDSYISEHKIKKPLVVVTGHSRGAAAGNILATDITGNSNYEKVYAYLFATPNVTKSPNKNLKNVINVCNELDFVAYIPFSAEFANYSWGFLKNGVTYSFNSKSLLQNNSKFKSTITNEYKEPDYNWNALTVQDVGLYAVGTWKTVEEYYKHDSKTYSSKNTNNSCTYEAYDYFYNGLALAASGDWDGISYLLGHFHGLSKEKSLSCPFMPLTCFFGVNGAGAKLSAFKDCHTIETYHATIYSNAKLNLASASLFSTETYGNDTVEINQDEYDALYSFFSQSENELMLEVAGWDIEDASTWDGIKWNTDGNVVSINLSYLNLSGWFNANNFPKLQDLNIDGNSLTMLAVSECSELVNLSCMSNNLSSLAVNECSNLQNLDCGFNQISSLDVSNMSQLSELNCYGNQINDLDLSGASALQTVRCGNNELYTVDISTNTSLNTFYCDNNNIVESQNAELLNSINAINANGGSAIIGTQKYNENYTFNTAELSSLTEFANMSLNLEKLGWDLDDPYTWQGVEWKIIGGEYHITAINFDGLELEGDFNLPEAEYVESVSCENSSLTTLNLAGCTSLSSVNCYNSGISSLEIENCSSLADINCDENYLEIEDIESSLSQIGLSTGIATYETQNIAADEETFNQVERDVLIAFLSTGTNADVLGWDWNWPGTWDGIVWTNADGEYRVNKIDFGDKDVDLSAFEYLEDFDFSGSQIETVVLPNCITKIPEFAFYNSGIKYIHMSEGVTNIEKSAFSYCDDLNTIVLPSTVTRIMDNAFYESQNLKNLVFIGNEPAEVGVEIAHGTSSEFNIIFFNDSTWNGATELLNDYSYITKEDNYIVLLDENIELKDDSYYNETNNYAGDDINVTIISKTPGASATCLLSVYDELGGFNELASVPVEMNRYMTVATFEDIDIQYVGEEYCTLKTFLWSNLNSLKPLTTATEKVLIKPVVE